jgi:hypothetical protein
MAKERFACYALVALFLTAVIQAQPLANVQSTNPMTVSIRPPTLDVAATKVRLLALSDDAAKTKEILGDDEQALAQILPYSVLIKNESVRKLKAIGVRFQWFAVGDTRYPRKLILTLTMDSEPEQMIPGGYRLFTPVQAVNQYLSQSPSARKGGHFRQAVGQQHTSLTLADTIQQGLDRLQIASGFEAYLEGVVFEDYSFVGSPMLRQALVRYNDLIH